MSIKMMPYYQVEITELLKHNETKTFQKMMFNEQSARTYVDSMIRLHKAVKASIIFMKEDGTGEEIYYYAAGIKNKDVDSSKFKPCKEQEKQERRLADEISRYIKKQNNVCTH